MRRCRASLTRATRATCWPAGPTRWSPTAPTSRSSSSSSVPRTAPSRPATYGIDFYGDNLCTSEARLKAHPEQAAAFRAASLKGWAYALAHKEAIVDLILRSYSQKKSREALLFEAARMETLVARDPGRDR